MNKTHLRTERRMLYVTVCLFRGQWIPYKNTHPRRTSEGYVVVVQFSSSRKSRQAVFGIGFEKTDSHRMDPILSGLTKHTHTHSSFRGIGLISGYDRTHDACIEESVFVCVCMCVCLCSRLKTHLSIKV